MRPSKKPPHQKLITTMRMTSQVYRAINKHIGLKPAERGGILLSLSNDYTITGFVYDKKASQKKNVYQPNTNFLNRVLKGRNEEFVGIVHSHPPGFRRLTVQDRYAAWSNLTSPTNLHLQAYLMPIIQTVPDTGKFEIIPYIVICHPKGKGKVLVKEVELLIVD
jgi:proteasome lid subunit RPN8/RPN11